MKTLAICLLALAAVSAIVVARDSVSGEEVTGTFRDRRSGSEFRIEALGGGKLHVEFHGLYKHKDARGEETANMGYGAGTAKIEGDAAIFYPEGVEETCTITLEFSKPGVLEAAEEGDSTDCGFGHNVHATGVYHKVSSAKPKFGEDE